MSKCKTLFCTHIFCTFSYFFNEKDLENQLKFRKNLSNIPKNQFLFIVRKIYYMIS